jgi:hypothetical protein
MRPTDDPDDLANIEPDDLAALDEWLSDLEPGCDGFYIETRLVRALRDAYGEALAIAGELAQLAILRDDSYPPVPRVYLRDGGSGFHSPAGVDVEALLQRARRLVALARQAAAQAEAFAPEERL